jgi:hypothetical protein
MYQPKGAQSQSNVEEGQREQGEEGEGVQEGEEGEQPKNQLSKYPFVYAKINERWQVKYNFGLAKS